MLSGVTAVPPVTEALFTVMLVFTEEPAASAPKPTLPASRLGSRPVREPLPFFPVTSQSSRSPGRVRVAWLSVAPVVTVRLIAPSSVISTARVVSSPMTGAGTPSPDWMGIDRNSPLPS